MSDRRYKIGHEVCYVGRSPSSGKIVTGVEAFILGVLEHDRSKFVKAYERKLSRLSNEIRATESDATPQAEVNAAVRAILRNSGLE